MASLQTYAQHDALTLRCHLNKRGERCIVLQDGDLRLHLSMSIEEAEALSASFFAVIATVKKLTPVEA